MHIVTQIIAGINPQQAIFIADVIRNGFQIFTTKRSITVKANANTNGIRNLKRVALLFDNRTGKKHNTYPIKVPIQAVGTQKTVLVYTAQVNNSKQIERRLVTVKTSNFFDLKKDVKVGTKEFAQSKDANTIINQERV